LVAARWIDGFLSKGYVRKVSFDNVELQPRELAGDPKAMRALAHPVRMRLLEELTLSGPLTATQCGERIGESPSSCSYHLRMLAKYGFVAEAEGGAGRQRPWRAVTLGNRWQDEPGRPAGERTAAAVLSAQVRRRDAELLADHLQHADRLPAEWHDAVIHSNWGGYLTAEELRDIGEQLEEIWQPYLLRLRDPSRRPAGARLVHMYAHGFPRVGEAPASSPEQLETAAQTGDDDA
jgi:DNA-binding transcriptional ArsR family regulator